MFYFAESIRCGSRWRHQVLSETPGDVDPVVVFDFVVSPSLASHIAQQMNRGHWSEK